MQIASGVEGERYVLLHQADVEPCLVREVEDELGAGLQHRRADRAFRHYVDREFRVDAGAFGEHEALGEREHLDGEADVDGELEHESLLSPPTMIVSVPVCTWGTLPDTGASSIAAPSSRTRLRDCATRLRADRAHVDPDLLVGEARKDSVGPGGDALQHAVVGEGREDEVGRLCDLARCIAPGEPLCDEVLRILEVARFAVDRVSGGKEPGCHVSAHVSKPDKAECGHDQFLLSIVSMSSSLSSRLAAIRIGSTWSGRRKRRNSGGYGLWNLGLFRFSFLTCQLRAMVLRAMVVPSNPERTAIVALGATRLSSGIACSPPTQPSLEALRNGV